MIRIFGTLMVTLALCSCAAGGKQTDSDTTSTEVSERVVPQFSGDSAMLYAKRQVEFGPRVPGSAAHTSTADWLVSELRRHGAAVSEQTDQLTAFDGTRLPMRNIFGRFNPDRQPRILLLAHYDTRPWADQDPDPANHTKALPGANDGASGVAVLLETARQIGKASPEVGVDILFVDCEDYGTEGDDSSWALGAEKFATKASTEGYTPREAILLDMVGGKDAVFPAEYFSQTQAPEVSARFRAAARRAGYGNRFPEVYGGAVTDDHIKLLDIGIPAIDIIEYREEGGFNPTWHTMQDDIEHLDARTLKAVGQTLLEYLYSN